MTSSPKFHVQVYNVEGLNMGKEKYFWNDKLMFKDAGTEHGNIAEVHIFIDRLSPEMDLPSFESGIDVEGLYLINIFLSCFRLVNGHRYLVLDETEVEEYSAYDIEDFKSDLRTTTHNRSETNLPKYPEEDDERDLTNTIPLFEKVIRNIDVNEKEPKNTLAISLHLFQRIDSRDNLKFIIDSAVILESLVCENEGDLKKKFASRTASLLQTSNEDKQRAYEFLKYIYRLRSESIHGSKISLDMFSEKHTGDRLKLEEIVRHALLEYVELIDSGHAKKEIIRQLDSVGSYYDSQR